MSRHIYPELKTIQKPKLRKLRMGAEWLMEIKQDVDSFKLMVNFALTKALYFKDSAYLDEITILHNGGIFPEMQYYCPFLNKTVKLYFFLYFLLDADGEIVYIGQTKCIDRISAHRSGYNNKRGMYSTVAYVPIFEENYDILKTEKLFIQTFCPSLNKKHNENKSHQKG